MTNGMQSEDEDIDVAADAIAWRHSATGHTYAFTSPPYRALVWQTEASPWAAVVTSDGSSLSKYDFATAEDAKAWCAARVIGSAGPLADTAADLASQPWRYRAPDQNYSLGAGNIHCRVRCTAPDTWGAVVTQPGVTKRTQTFDTLEEAQAWCEEQITRRQAST